MGLLERLREWRAAKKEDQAAIDRARQEQQRIGRRTGADAQRHVRGHRRRIPACWLTPVADPDTLSSVKVRDFDAFVVAPDNRGVDTQLESGYGRFVLRRREELRLRYSRPIGVRLPSRVRQQVRQFIHQRMPSADLTFPLGSFGRLGNQLWQIAGTLALARQHGLNAFFRNDWAYRAYFALPSWRYAGRVAIARCQDGWPLASNIAEEWRVYLQDVGLWNGYENEILAELQPSRMAHDATRPFAHLLSLPSSTALHVRRGDYTSGNSFHRPAGLSYYERALAMLREDALDPQLLIFSDDIEWCRENLRLDAEMHFIEGNPDWVDLTIMTLCEHHICAPSTFSWWGAMLSGDPSPIVPWLDVWPNAFRAARPTHWRAVEVESGG